MVVINPDMEQQPKALDSYVGFANLPNQLYRKSVKQGFEFTLMVVGESGLGKSTLINSLFLSDLYSGDYPGPSLRIKKTVKVETTKVLIKENGVTLRLTIDDTPGFGDAVDNSNCWQAVINHIEKKFEDYLNSESMVTRTKLADNRVHCCLYFIAPTGHGLKPLDIEFMKNLHDKVNIIPLIAKADTMTPDECLRFKKQIMKEIHEHKIQLYEFPECEDEEENKLNRKLKVWEETRGIGNFISLFIMCKGNTYATQRIMDAIISTIPLKQHCVFTQSRVPFAVVGSNMVLEVGGRRVRGRQYPWGVAEVENIDHCDFTVLRNMLVRTHMQNLKYVTNSVHYENYLMKKLN
uniref:Septin-7 n=1 Tax=Ciona savignyi TaxID=51511 RepID=H2Z606_CIOSA